MNSSGMEASGNESNQPANESEQPDNENKQPNKERDEDCPAGMLPVATELDWLLNIRVCRFCVCPALSLPCLLHSPLRTCTAWHPSSWR